MSVLQACGQALVISLLGRESRAEEGEEGVEGCGREHVRGAEHADRLVESGHRREAEQSTAKWALCLASPPLPRTLGSHRTRAGFTSLGTDFCCTFRSFKIFVFTGKILKRHLKNSGSVLSAFQSDPSHSTSHVPSLGFSS